MLKQYDVVQINTTKRIRYVSGPQNHAAQPNGYWSVVAIIDGDVLVAKDDTLVRVPIADTQKVAGYNLDHFFKELETAGMEPKQYFNVVELASSEFQVDVSTARKFLMDHNFKITTQSEQERAEIVRKAKELWQRK